MTGETPFFLQGNYAPISMECEAAHLPVVGELPRGLRGTLYRNGPNPQFPPADPASHHWFLGDGMVHAFTFRDGRALYRNRWVRTPKFLREAAAGRAGDGGWAGVDDGGLANTNILSHAGHLLALEEANLPIELDPGSLDTIGPQSFGGRLQGPFTAHPKTDPVTGEMVFFGIMADGPFGRGMTYGTLDRAGRVTRLERFEAPYCSMVHDFAVTDRHVVFPVLPLSGSMERAMRGGSPFAWEPELGAYLGVLRRDQGVESLLWFRAEPCFVFHVMNAWEEKDGRIVIDVMQSDQAPLFPRADGAPPSDSPARLTRWTIDPQANSDAFRAARLDDLPGEFPRFDERRLGRRNRYGAFAANVRSADFDAIAWLDLSTGRRSLLELPAGDATSEPVFVPRAPDAEEGDGWLLAVIWRRAENRSDLVVLDTSSIEKGPVATVQLSHRVPFGFHGNFVAEEG